MQKNRCPEPESLRHPRAGRSYIPVTPGNTSACMPDPPKTCVDRSGRAGWAAAVYSGRMTKSWCHLRRPRALRAGDTRLAPLLMPGGHRLALLLMPGGHCLAPTGPAGETQSEAQTHTHRLAHWQGCDLKPCMNLLHRCYKPGLNLYGISHILKIAVKRIEKVSEDCGLWLIYTILSILMLRRILRCASRRYLKAIHKLQGFFYIHHF